MEFTLPRTKSEMYSTLKSIYAHYRLNAVVYTDAQKEPLNLAKMTMNVLSNAQLLLKAETLVKPSVIREKQERKDKLNESLEKLSLKQDKLEEDYKKIYDNVEKDYEKIKESIKKEAIKKGLTYSSLTTEKMYEAESEKANLIAKYQSEKATKQSEINVEISTVQSEISSLDAFYSDLLNKDISKKFEELNDEQEKTKREIFKYNNSIESSIVRYRNTNLMASAELELKYLEVRAKGFSKEALVDMGYYADVIDCICGYYDTLHNDVTAFNEIKKETELMVYLDEFYSDVLLIYKVRAGY